MWWVKTPIIIFLLFKFGDCEFQTCNALNQDELSPPIINLKLGQIQGTIIRSRLGRKIYSFRGVRYAEPPIGELRFQPSVPIGKWSNVYNATEDGPLCPQPTTDPTSEDCLFLNVYTTKLPSGNENPKRPVVVYIHTGGFYSFGGTSYFAGPNYFLDQDIVFVTINYRLGTLGFLSTGGPEAPGNNGLKDQVLALKWVQENIESFGGDPNSVTIMGYSAGAASVTLHLVSPMSRGLFHKAIAMSGSNLGNWPIPYNQLNVARKQAEIVGCPKNVTPTEIVNCLKTISATNLGNSLPKFKEFADDPILVWFPVIEKEDYGQVRFLPDHPIKLIEKGEFAQVPFLTGVTNDEYVERAFTIVRNNSLIRQINEDFEKIFPIAFIYERNSDQSKSISKALKSFYLKDKPVDQSSLTPLAHLYSEGIIGFSVNRAAKLISTKSSQAVYYYKFSYRGRYSHFYRPDRNNSVPYGVVHHDDLIYLFYISKFFPLFGIHEPKEVEMVEKLGMLWGNFITTGNPIPEITEKLDSVVWEPFNNNSEKYMDLDKRLVLKTMLNHDRYNTWDKVIPLIHN